MPVESPERGLWMLDRNGYDLYESVESPRESGRFRCKLCSLAGVDATFARKEFDRHRREHDRAAQSKTIKESDGMAEVSRPDGDLTTQLKRITKRIASTQHQLVHPEKYASSGKWNGEQKAKLEQRLKDEKALRERIRVDLAAAKKPADAAETKKETLDGKETKKEQAPKSPQVTPDPKKKPATSRKAAAKKTTARRKTAAKKTTAKKATARKTTAKRRTSRR